MKKILINIATKKATENINTEYINLYEQLFLNNGIKTFQLYIGDSCIEDIEYENILNKKGIYIKKITKNDFKELLSELNSNYKIIYVNTFTEDLIEQVIKMNDFLGLKNPENKDIFRNKNIQRQLIQDYDSEIGIKFLEFTIENIDLNKIENFIGYPFILKPSSGIQSAGVSKINNRDDFKGYIDNYKVFLKNFRDRGFDNEVILAEEFIDGEMYSIDYYVDESHKVFISKPVKVELANTLGINDFFNYSRIISKNVEEELKNYDLYDFVNKTVKATKIRNFFIHHEFKLTTKGKLKTIEINGRIGGYRAGMYFRGYDLNLFNFLLINYKNISLKANNAVLHIHPDKKGILKSFNDELFLKIEELSSVFMVKKITSFLGKNVGLTKDGFPKTAIVKLKNNNIKQFEEDLDFIKNNYKELLILK